MQGSKISPQLKVNIFRFLFIVSIFVSWELLATYRIIDPFYTSQPLRIYTDLKEFYASGQLVRHLSITLQEALWGLFLGTILGIVVGFILGRMPIISILSLAHILMFIKESWLP